MLAGDRVRTKESKNLGVPDFQKIFSSSSPFLSPSSLPIPPFPHKEELAFLRLEVAQNREDLDRAAHYGRDLLQQCASLR